MKKLLVLLAVLLLVGNAMAVLPLEPKECREVELVKSELRADVEFPEFKYIAWPGLLGAGACGFGSGFTDFYTDYGITSSLAGFYDYDKADPKIYAIYAFDLDGRDQEKKICPFEEDCDFIRDCVDIQINGKTYWRLEHDNFKTGDKTDIFWSGYGLTAADESQGWSFGLNDVYLFLIAFAAGLKPLPLSRHIQRELIKEKFPYPFFVPPFGHLGQISCFYRP